MKIREREKKECFFGRFFSIIVQMYNFQKSAMQYIFIHDNPIIFVFFILFVSFNCWINIEESFFAGQAAKHSPTEDLKKFAEQIMTGFLAPVVANCRESEKIQVKKMGRIY